jgi:hypothetical protein
MNNDLVINWDAKHQSSGTSKRADLVVEMLYNYSFPTRFAFVPLRFGNEANP